MADKDKAPVEHHHHHDHSFKHYSKPANFGKIIGNRMAIFGTWGLIGYLGHFFLIIISINLYCDSDRLLSCNSEWKNGDERNSEIFDKALVLLAAYHLIEWVRIIMFLVTIILGQNLVFLYYVSGINTLFGLAAYIVTHVARFNEEGKACAEVQTYRAAFLTAEVIVFWLTFHIMSFPNFFLFVMKKENIQEAMKEKSGSDSEEEK